MQRPATVTPDRAARTLTGMLTVAGLAHFLLPRAFDGIVPPSLPGRARWYTYASGVAELACAAGLTRPRTRRAGSAATVALLLAVWPANIQMAWDWRRRHPVLLAGAVGRLPLQVPLIALARRAGAAA